MTFILLLIFSLKGLLPRGEKPNPLREKHNAVNKRLAEELGKTLPQHRIFVQIVILFHCMDDLLGYAFFKIKKQLSLDPARGPERLP